MLIESKKKEKYWIIVNSWNEDWGHNGDFLMRRGTNEGGIEESVFASLPDLKHYDL